MHCAVPRFCTHSPAQLILYLAHQTTRCTHGPTPLHPPTQALATQLPRSWAGCWGGTPSASAAARPGRALQLPPAPPWWGGGWPRPAAQRWAGPAVMAARQAGCGGGKLALGQRCSWRRRLHCPACWRRQPRSWTTYLCRSIISRCSAAAAHYGGRCSSRARCGVGCAGPCQSKAQGAPSLRGCQLVGRELHWLARQQITRYHRPSQLTHPRLSTGSMSWGQKLSQTPAIAAQFSTSRQDGGPGDAQRGVQSDAARARGGGPSVAGDGAPPR